jgi:hypothetical protein
MVTSPTEFAFVLVGSMLIAQAFAVGCLWLFVEFIRAPEHVIDWFDEDEDEEEYVSILDKLAATHARLDVVCADCDGTLESVKHQACKCEREFDEHLTTNYCDPKK